MEGQKKVLHLICNAHLDPVWLWNLEEGISAALSTFQRGEMAYYGRKVFAAGL